ncbi:MAG: NAD(P)H-hydrate epimerase [Nitrososphaerales archaeon]
MSTNIITPEQMRIVEERSAALGVSRLLLMENAGCAVAKAILDSTVNLSKGVLVVAGLGNNGGDGFVAARHLASGGVKVKVILLGKGEEIKGEEAAINWKIISNMKRSIVAAEANNRETLLRCKELFDSSSVIVDAIFGTGIKGEVREPFATAIDLINGSNAYKVSVDIPSGLDPTTGEVQSKAVKADLTITFHKAKPGLFKNKKFVGKLIIAPIGIPPEAEM